MFRSFSLAAAVSVILVGVLVLLGWTFDIEVLKRLVCGRVSMNPVTALAFILCGVSLRLSGKEHPDPWTLRSARAGAFAVAVVGLLRLGTYLAGWNNGIDAWLFAAKLGASVNPIPNRMAPNTALTFVLIGLGLMLLDRERSHGRRPAQYFVLTAALIAMLAVIGYAYGVKHFYDVPSFIPMALPTALSFFTLSLGILCVRPDRGLMAIVTSGGGAGALARRLLPAAVALPVLLGWLRLAGQRAGWYGSEFGVALMVVTLIVMSIALIGWNARLLHAADCVRLRAEEALRQAHDGLEARVRERGAELARVNESLVAEVAERRRGEAELLREREFLQAILQNLSDGIVACDAEGVLTLFNRAAEGFLGLSGESIPSERWSSHYGVYRADGSTPMPEEEIPLFRAWRGETVRDAEIVISSKGRPPQTHLVSGQPFFDAQGQKRGAVVVMHDVTARKSAEEKIREQAALLDVTQDAILVRDLEDHISYWNRGAERLYGWSGGEAIGRDADALLSRGTRDVVAEARSAVMVDGRWAGEFGHLAKDGREIVVQSRWSLILDDAGLPRSILVVNTDITEAKRMESQFLRTQRMEGLGRLAGGIAHDLNNVLTPITMAIELLGLKMADSSGRAMLKTLQQNAERGAAMVKQILTFARGVEGVRVVLQAGAILGEVERMIRPTLPKAIAIRVERPADLWPIRADETQLFQVLMNLCVNARDAMPGGGELTITATNAVLDARSAHLHPDARPGPHVLIAVADTGTGIPPEILDQVFDPFFTTKAIGQGTGLGLSTVLGIVKGHGGFVKVYSEVGRGTRFAVYLPAAEPARLEIAGVAEAGLPCGCGETILVVDDEAPILEVARGVLEAHGYRVLTAGAGSEALALYERHNGEIAAVLTDMMMPTMDGPATIRALRRVAPQVRVIAASGLAEGGRAAEADPAGVQAFLLKPYTAATLLAALRDVLAAG